MFSTSAGGVFLFPKAAQYTLVTSRESSGAHSRCARTSMVKAQHTSVTNDACGKRGIRVKGGAGAVKTVYAAHTPRYGLVGLLGPAISLFTKNFSKFMSVLTRVTLNTRIGGGHLESPY